MTRNIATTILLLSLTLFQAQAQYDESSDFHIGLVYPLSTNGIKAINYSNKFSLHAIAGISGNEENFALSGCANFVMQDANGFIGAGSANAVLGDVNGAQLAGFMNFTGGNTRGLQGAGFGNLTIQHASGAQLGGFMNIAKSVDGFQGAGFMNISGDMDGAQIAGFMNIAKDVDMQAAGFLNKARNVSSVQLSGFMNIADSSDYPIGLINIIRTGEKAIGVTVDQNLTSMLAFRSGGRVLYGIVGVGGNFKNYDDPVMAIELGLGAHIHITRHFRINTEAVMSGLSDYSDGAEFATSIRILPAVKLGMVEIFGGPTFNYFNITDDYSNSVIDTYAWGSYEYGEFHGAQFGVIGGIQLHL